MHYVSVFKGSLVLNGPSNNRPNENLVQQIASPHACSGPGIRIRSFPKIPIKSLIRCELDSRNDWVKGEDTCSQQDGQSDASKPSVFQKRLHLDPLRDQFFGRFYSSGFGSSIDTCCYDDRIIFLASLTLSLDNIRLLQTGVRKLSAAKGDLA